MDWKKYFEQLLWDYRSRKFLLAVGFIIICLFNYAEYQGIGKFGMPESVLLLIAMVCGLFIWVEGMADMEERSK